MFKRWKPIIYYAEDDKGNVVFIAPMKSLKSSGEIDTLGNIPQCDIADFLYDKVLTDKNAILLQLQQYIGKPFLLSRIMSTSEIAECFKDDSTLVGTHDCVNIHLPDSYETYIATLSKSVRQNIRTSYNRLQRDNVNICLKMYFGGSFPKSETKDNVRCGLTKKFKRDTKML